MRLDVHFQKYQPRNQHVTYYVIWKSASWFIVVTKRQFRMCCKSTMVELALWWSATRSASAPRTSRDRIPWRLHSCGESENTPQYLRRERERRTSAVTLYGNAIRKRTRTDLMPDLVRSISRPSPAISVSHSLAMKRSFRLNISLPMRLFAYWRCDLIDRRFPVRTQVVCRVRWRSALPLTLCVRAARRAHSLKGFVYLAWLSQNSSPKDSF